MQLETEAIIEDLPSYDVLRAEASDEGFAKSNGSGPIGIRVWYGLSAKVKLCWPCALSRLDILFYPRQYQQASVATRLRSRSKRRQREWPASHIRRFPQTRVIRWLIALMVLPIATTSRLAMLPLLRHVS
jgi:hypothetical protein